MAGRQRTEMDAIEIADFLDTQQTGVLSLARDNDSYCIPVSFLFNEKEHAVYLRLGYGRSSTKRQFVDAVDRATFLSYARTDDGWKSVMARGKLEAISEGELDSQQAEFVRNLKIPYFRVHSQSTEDLQFDIVRINVTELTGIASGGNGRD